MPFTVAHREASEQQNYVMYTLEIEAENVRCRLWCCAFQQTDYSQIIYHQPVIVPARRAIEDSDEGAEGCRDVEKGCLEREDPILMTGGIPLRVSNGVCRQ